MLFDFEVSNILGLFMGVVTMKLGYFDWWDDQKMLKISQFAPLYPTGMLFDFEVCNILGLYPWE